MQTPLQAGLFLHDFLLRDLKIYTSFQFYVIMFGLMQCGIGDKR